MRPGTATIALVLVALGPGASRVAAAEPATTPSETTAAARDGSGLIVPRFGRFDGTVGGDPYLLRGWEVAVLVQPWRRSDAPRRGLFVSGRIGGWSGDFSSFSRTGLTLGYLYKARPVSGFVTFGVSAAATVDRWDVWLESPEPGEWSSKAMALGGAVRPFVRLGRLEISVPLEFGYGLGPRKAYRSRGLHVGLVLF